MFERLHISGSSIYKSILAGFVIGLGSIGYLVINNQYVGAFLFAIGLTSILTFRWRLFTGVLCSYDYLSGYISSYIGNFAGAFICASIYFLTYGISHGREIAKISLEGKYSKSVIQVIFAGVLCEVCIFIAVTGFRRCKNDIGRYLLVVMSVMTFVLCGFEHSIANSFYTLVYAPSITKFLYFNLGSVLGNIIGAIGMRLLVRRAEK